MSPRKKLPFEHIPFRKKGYGTQAAVNLLTERGMTGLTPRKLRYAADHGEIDSFPSGGGHRRFSAKELERYLLVKFDKLTSVE